MDLRLPMTTRYKQKFYTNKTNQFTSSFSPVLFVAPVQHGPRCAKCDTVEHPSHCLAITECPIGEVIIINENNQHANVEIM